MRLIKMFKQPGNQDKKRKLAVFDEEESIQVQRRRKQRKEHPMTEGKSVFFRYSH